MALNEADTWRLRVTPNLHAAGRETSPHLLNEKKVLTDGRIFAAEGTVTKGPQKRADFGLTKAGSCADNAGGFQTRASCD